MLAVNIVVGTVAETSDEDAEGRGDGWGQNGLGG